MTLSNAEFASLVQPHLPLLGFREKLASRTHEDGGRGAFSKAKVCLFLKPKGKKKKLSFFTMVLNFFL